MIDPNEITTARVGELPPSNFELTDNIPHEIDGTLFRGTVQQLGDTISDYIGAVSGSSYNNTVVPDGGTLPETTVKEWLFVGKGTFHNVGGQPDIITTEELNILSSNGSYWSLAVEIPIDVELAGITQNIRSGYTETTPSEDAVFKRIAEIIGMIPNDTDDILNSSNVDGDTATDAINNLNTKVNEVNEALPLGTKGQIIKVSEDNVREYYTADIVSLGKYVSTDEELEEAKETPQTQEEIFETFERYSHGDASLIPTSGVLSNLIPGTPLHTNSWEYDTIDDRILSTINSGDVVGLISKYLVGDYIQKATIGSNAVDNDFIGLVLFFEDVNDLVPNNAFGLDPADFNWEVDVTSEFIPNQHTLTFFRNRNAVNTFFIVYNYMKLDQSIIVNGTSSGVWNTTSDWSGAEVDVYVSKINDIITFKTSNFSDAPGGKGGLDFELTLDLNSDARLEKFKGFNSYGYCAHSQSDSFFYNTYITNSVNDIFDVRNGDVWSLGDDDVYYNDTTRNLYNEQIKSIGFNETTTKLFYFYDNTYVILSEFKKSTMLSVTVNTYADMLALPDNSNTITVRVLVDEDKGIDNTEYKIYPDTKRIWIATTEDN